MFNDDDSGDEPAAAKAPVVKAPPKGGRSMFDNGALQDSDDDAPAPKAAAAKKAPKPKKSKGGLFDDLETELEVAESEEEKPTPKAPAGSDGMKNALAAALAKRAGAEPVKIPPSYYITLVPLPFPSIHNHLRKKNKLATIICNMQYYLKR